MLLGSLEGLYLALINVLKGLVIRLQNSLAGFSQDIFLIIEKGLERGSICVKLEMYELMATCFEYISSFSSLDFSRLMQIIQIDWDYKLEKQNQNLVSERNHSSKKRKVTIEKIQSPYDGLQQHLSIRKQLINGIFF